MAWNECDACGKTTYSDENPLVEYRQQRPSNTHDMCCTLAGHMKCLGINNISELAATSNGGIATRKQWNDWIESKSAYDAGFLVLT